MPAYLIPIQAAFIEMWATLVSLLPQFIFALVTVLIGLLVAHVLREAVIRVTNLLKIDDALHKLEVHALVGQTGIELNVGKFLGWLVKWFVILLTLIVVADALQWNEVTMFLANVANYIPNVLIAVVILLVGVLLGRFVQDAIMGALKAAQMKSTAGFLSSLAKWAIYVFSFMAALVHLNIAASLIQTLFVGFVAMVALAGGLAFGLGGKEHASKVLSSLLEDLKRS